MLFRLCSKFVVNTIGSIQVRWTTFLHKSLIIRCFPSFYVPMDHLVCSRFIGSSLGSSLGVVPIKVSIDTSRSRNRLVAVLKCVLATVDDIPQTLYSSHHSIS